MERSEVRKKIIEFADNNVGIDESLSDEQKEQLRIVEDLGGDSLDMLEIIMDTEREYGITVTDEEGKRLFADDPTVGEIVDFMMQKISEQAE